MKQTGDNEMNVVRRFDPAGHRQPLQDVAANHGDQPCMLVIVIQSVASANAFDGDPGKRTETLCQFVVRWTKDFPEVAGEKFSELASRRRRNGFHRHSPPEVAAANLFITALS